MIKVAERNIMSRTNTDLFNLKIFFFERSAHRRKWMLLLLLLALYKPLCMYAIQEERHREFNVTRSSLCLCICVFAFNYLNSTTIVPIICHVHLQNKLSYMSTTNYNSKLNQNLCSYLAVYSVHAQNKILAQ